MKAIVRFFFVALVLPALYFSAQVAYVRSFPAEPLARALYCPLFAKLDGYCGAPRVSGGVFLVGEALVLLILVLLAITLERLTTTGKMGIRTWAAIMVSAVMIGHYARPRVMPEPPEKQVPRANWNVNPYTGTPQKSAIEWESYDGFNNLKDCSESVREAIHRVDTGRWGAFDVQCFGERVTQVNSSTSAPLSSDYLKFIVENYAIFGLHATPVIELDGRTRGEQLYRGVRVGGGGVYPEMVRNKGRYRDENYFKLQVRLQDTHEWKFDPTPRLSREAASAAARSFWVKQYPRWKRLGEETLHAEYLIRRPLKETTNCPTEPGGEWRLRVCGRGLGMDIGCGDVYVDGKTGYTCGIADSEKHRVAR